MSADEALPVPTDEVDAVVAVMLFEVPLIKRNRFRKVLHVHVMPPYTR